MHATTTLALLAVVASAAAGPVVKVVEQHIVEVEKRQADVSQVLQLASLAGINGIPTDPAILSSIAPLANSLAAQLPSPAVISALVTAAPSGFFSSLVNDPSYAASFQSAFAAGSSPSWYNNLPTDVKSYLHTYTGAGLGGGYADSTDDMASAMSGASMTASGTDTMASSSASASMSMTSESASRSMMSESTSRMSSSMSKSKMSGSSSSSSMPTSSSSSAGAAKPTAVMAAGVIGAMGVLGLAVGL